MITRLTILLKKDRYISIIILLFLIGAFLRFYKLDAFVTFLGDQARDAIILKRIITFEHFPAIGPPTSIGQVYLGPFYYYFIAPWLALFRFDPIGPAYGVAFFSSLYILANYFIVSVLLDKRVALLSTFFITFSSTLIDFSRFSWNPNLLPLFTLLTLYFFIAAFSTRKNHFFILAGAFLSFCIQLHYLSLFLVPALIIFSIRHLFQHKKFASKYFIKLFYTALSFVFFSAPLLIFDLRHDFLNSKNFIKLFQSNAEIATSKFSNFIHTGISLETYSLAIQVHELIFIILFVSTILFSLFLAFRTKGKIADFFLIFVVTLLGISLLGGPKYPHYFGVIYPFYFIAIAYFLLTLPKNKLSSILVGLFVFSFIIANSQKYYFSQNGAYQIGRAKKISRVIFNNVKSEKYTLTAIPEVYSDHTARYFLEVWGKKPQERELQKRTQELFVICEKPCNPIGNPLYDIAHFAPTKIVGKWKADDVTIYKLTR